MNTSQTTSIAQGEEGVERIKEREGEGRKGGRNKGKEQVRRWRGGKRGKEEGDE